VDGAWKYGKCDGGGGRRGEGKDVIDGPVRVCSRLQVDLKPRSQENQRPRRLTGELCCFEAGKGMGPAPMWSIVGVSVRAHCRKHIAAGSSERRRTRVGARPLLRMTKIWLSMDVDESVSGAERDLEEMRVG
jgi:hypothetical protein